MQTKTAKCKTKQKEKLIATANCFINAKLN